MLRRNAGQERADDMDAIIERYGEVQAAFDELDGDALDGRALVTTGRTSLSTASSLNSDCRPLLRNATVSQRLDFCSKMP